MVVLSGVVRTAAAVSIFSSLFLMTGSSKSILIDGVYVSSYCPFFTDQIKLKRKATATSKLQQMSSMMAVIMSA